MYLKPVPRKIIMGEENFTLNYYDSIVLSSKCSFGDLETAKILQKNIEKILFFKLSIKKAYKKDFKNNTICWNILWCANFNSNNKKSRC